MELKFDPGPECVWETLW